MLVFNVDNGLKKIDYIDISKCSANERGTWERGFIDFIENKDIEIITKDNQRILLTVADTGHVNQTLADLISWAVHQVSLSEKQSLQIG